MHDFFIVKHKYAMNKIFLTIPFFNYYLQAKLSTNKYQKHKYIDKLNIMN